jgi:hypothetical protein
MLAALAQQICIAAPGDGDRIARFDPVDEFAAPRKFDLRTWSVG